VDEGKFILYCCKWDQIIQLNLIFASSAAPQYTRLFVPRRLNCKRPTPKRLASIKKKIGERGVNSLASPSVI